MAKLILLKHAPPARSSPEKRILFCLVLPSGLEPETFVPKTNVISVSPREHLDFLQKLRVFARFLIFDLFLYKIVQFRFLRFF